MPADERASGMHSPAADDTPAPAPELTRVLERSRELGFLGPGPVEDHIAHAQRLQRVLHDLGLPERTTAVDLGSGGGLPGLVLAASTRGWSWILLDAMERRTAFLAQVVRELGFDHVEVRRERAEATGRSDLRGGADLVVARSFGAPAVTAECGAPLLRAGGVLVVSEPPEPADDRWPPEGLAQLGLDAIPGVVGSWVALRQVRPCPDRFPRKVGQPAKRPLW